MEGPVIMTDLFCTELRALYTQTRWPFVAILCGRSCFYLSHFKDKETGVQNGEATCLKLSKLENSGAGALAPDPSS